MMEFQGVTLIIKALVATTAMFSATALFGWVTQKDLSGLRGFLMISLIGIIVVSIIGIFIPWGNNFEMIFAGFGVILFSGYTMYDIQQIKSSPGLSPIDAALRLYLDIFNLFIFILRLMGAFARD
jgi:FtsH-binding integral membrane protein